MTEIIPKLVQELNVFVLPLVIVAVILSVSGIRKGEPSGVIIGRWALWLCVSTGVAILLNRLGASSKPMWATALFCLLMWMFIETVYNWLAIDAISRSGLPLFPTYRHNEGGNQWPADRKFIALRENLRKAGLRSVASVIGKLGAEDYLRCSVYQSEDATLRLNLMFLPRGGGALSVFLAFSSLLENGYRIVTDNIFIPFGGFYPENMLLERHPLVRSIGRLMKIHARRVSKAASTPMIWEGDPVADMNELQKEIEKLNVSLGFLVDPSKREEDGNISREGRYRLWTELWTLNYLGRPKNYC
ncbi:MAG: hypothetical protein WC360_07425 [Opitutales bacterium]